MTVSSLVQSGYYFLSSLQYIVRAPWVPSSRAAMTAQLAWLSFLEGIGAPVHSARFGHFSVKFSSLHEFMALYREIAVHQQYFLPLATSRPRIIDAGANIGMATLYFKLRWPQAQIVAFEPCPETFDRLRANMNSNDLGDVELLNEAVGGKDGTATLIRAKGSAESHAASIALAEFPEGSASVAVPCRRLSPVIDTLGTVDLLKIDIEGSEYDVLCELEQAHCFAAIRSCIIEYHEGIAPLPVESAMSLLARNGFRCRLGAVEWRPWYKLDRPYGVMIYAVRKD